MAQSQMDREKLMAGLTEDLALARQGVAASEIARGAAPLPTGEITSFAPRAIRQRGQIIGEAHLTASKKAMDDAIESILKTTQFANEQEMNSARNELQSRMNKFQMQVIKSSAALDAKIKKAGYDQATSQAMWGMFTKAIGGTAAGAVAASGRSTGAPSGQSRVDTSGYNTLNPYAGHAGLNPYDE